MNGVNNDVHTLTGAYVLDALSEMERRAFEDHMSDCPACSQEVAELRETTARLGAATAASPPPDLWSKVLNATAQARQLPPLSDEDNVVRPKRWANRIGMFAAAAALIVAAGVGVGWYTSNSSLNDELAKTQTELTKLQSVLSAPDVYVRSTPVTGGGTATAVVSKGVNGMVMLVDDLPALPPDKQYQAWYLKSDGVLSAGLFTSADDSISADDLAPAAGATDLGLTVEKAGGVSTPSMNTLVRVPLPS